jgi:hypothetical protein
LSTIAAVGGYILFFIPGIIITTLLFFSTYFLIAEGQRSISALTRSWYFVRGYTGGIIWRLFVLGVITIGVTILIGLISGPIAFHPITNEFRESSFITPINVLGAILASAVMDLALMPFWLIYGYGMYIFLRQAKTEPSPNEEEAIRKKVWIWITVSLLLVLGAIVFTGALAYLILMRLVN